MSIIDWFFIGLIVLIFVIFMFFSWSDLFRDILYYKEKKKNVKSMKEHINKTSKKKINNNIRNNTKS